jgi:hypothetical protein
MLLSAFYAFLQLRHLKRVRKRPSLDGSPGSDLEVYICPSASIGDIPEDILCYFDSPLRTLDVCQVKPRDRADRDAFGLYWPVIFRPTGAEKQALFVLTAGCPELWAAL